MKWNKYWCNTCVSVQNRDFWHINFSDFLYKRFRQFYSGLSSAAFVFIQCFFPSVLWRCWLGGRKGIRPVKNWVFGCWHGYLSGVRCRLAYDAADATATHCLLISKIQIGFTFLVPAHLGSPGKRAIKRVCVCVCVCICQRRICQRNVRFNLNPNYSLLLQLETNVLQMTWNFKDVSNFLPLKH